MAATKTHPESDNVRNDENKGGDSDVANGGNSDSSNEDTRSEQPESEHDEESMALSTNVTPQLNLLGRQISLLRGDPSREVLTDVEAIQSQLPMPFFFSFQTITMNSDIP